MNVTMTLSDLLTGEQYIIIMESCSIVWIVLSFLGIISNVINVRTFIIMGLHDGMTLSFMVLSVFDMAYLIASFCLGVSVSFYITELKYKTRFQIEPYGVSIFFANIMILLNVTNVLTTTFLAVARCLCVAKPLHFKNYFTLKRTVIFLTSFAVLAVATYSPILVNMGMVNKHDSVTNITRPVLWVSQNRELIKDVVWAVIDMALPFTTQLVVAICVIIMTTSLRASSKFRQASALTLKKICHKNNDMSDHSTNTERNKNKMAASNSSSGVNEKLTSKDRRVVQQVILISVLYIICNTPKILISVIGTIEPEFTIGKRYGKLYLGVNSLRKHFEIFNSAVNTIIYFKYNNKFRKSMCL